MQRKVFTSAEVRRIVHNTLDANADDLRALSADLDERFKGRNNLPDVEQYLILIQAIYRRYYQLNAELERELVTLEKEVECE